jgi:hypothetical protein
MNDDWKMRLTQHLEPDLSLEDPSPKISAYHDMPYALFHYPPESEFDIRKAISLLVTRLENNGKRVTIISLSDCFSEAIDTDGDYSLEKLKDLETTSGCDSLTDEMSELLNEDARLVDLVISRLPATLDPKRDIVFLSRAGSLFPIYRTSALLEHLKGEIQVPTVLFYPGRLQGPTGLSFMGLFDPEPNYRPKIY